jgi:hypothetical protein
MKNTKKHMKTSGWDYLVKRSFQGKKKIPGSLLPGCLFVRFSGSFGAFARLIFGFLSQILRQIIKKSSIKANFKPFKGY